MARTKKVRFKGAYWWGDAKNVISILQKELEDVLSETRVHTITITGSDFNDGRESRHVELKVDTGDNTITVTKSY